MATKQIKKLSDLQKITTATGDQMIPVVDASGNVNPIKLTDLAQVVAGLIGISNRGKDALMPGFKNNGFHIDTGHYINIKIEKQYGYNFLFTIYKNHESSGFDIGFIYGYNKDVKLLQLLKGSYLTGIKSLAKDDKIDIFLLPKQYCEVSIEAVAYSNITYRPIIRLLSQEDNPVPEDAVDI